VNLERPVFLVSEDRADEPGHLAPDWPVVFVKELGGLRDLARLGSDFVFPLVSSSAGHVQGMLEFLGLAYAGASAEGFVWAHRQNGLQPLLVGEKISQRILYSGLNAQGRESAENTSQRFLRFSGWALVSTQTSDSAQAVLLEVSPKLVPGEGFLKKLVESGVTVERFFQAEVEAGLARFQVNRTLKTHYKDTV